MKNLKLTIIIILAALLVGAVVFGIITQKRLVTKAVELASVNEDLASRDMEIGLMRETSSDNQKTIDELSGKLEEAESAKVELSSQIEEQNSNITKLKADLSESESLYTTSQNNLKTLQNSIMCEEVPSEIDFTSNYTVSAALKDWIDEPNYSNATWETVWNNSKTTIHKITGEYLYEFVVYFDDTTGFTDRVFDIGGMCWVSK